MKFQVESQSSVSSRHKVQLNSPPASLQDWLDEELERRGIDAVIYTRYIFSILLQDSYDVNSCDHNAMNEDICSYYFCNDRKLQNHPTHHRHSGRKNSEKFICNQHQMGDQEQRKKSAAVECLMSVSEEKYGIVELVEDLCAKLKEFQLENDDLDDKKIKSPQQPPDEVIDACPSYEEQAKKYYAAFPALSGKSTDPIVKLSILSESSDMIVEKSAWMSGRQPLFDRKDFSLPNNEQNATIEGLEDRVDIENEICKQGYPSTISDGKISLIVPKVRSVKSNHSRLSTVFSKSKPSFQVNRSCNRIRKHVVQRHDLQQGIEISSSNKDGTDRRAEKFQEVAPLQKQEESLSKFVPVVSTPNEDDEMLAKFIDKFNTEDIAAIWDRMFQPQYLDSLLNIPKWKDSSIFPPSDNHQKYLSIWSSKGDLDDPLIFSNKNNWFDSNICINNCCFGSNCLQGLGNENTWPTHQSSFSLLGYCHDSEGSRRFSLTLSDESDDLCSLSHIFHETTAKELDNVPELDALSESSDSFNETSSVNVDNAITTANLNLVRPSEECMSLVMCTPSKMSSTDSLLTSERTHFRPIRQESSEQDEADLLPDLLESKYSSKHNEKFPSLENIKAKEDSKFDVSEGNESRDSWSPDMKDCFSNSPAWASCAPTSNTSDNPSTEFEEIPNSSEWSQVSETKHDKVVDMSSDAKCEEKSPLWACDSSSWNSEISELVHTINSDVEKDCKTPITVDVEPWINSNKIKTSETWSSESDKEYTSWKSNQVVWSDAITSSVDKKFKALDLPNKEKSDQECLSFWKRESSAKVVEALRVEIKEETKQLFDDIHDMINKEDVDDEDLELDINDEALCEWMLNVDLNSGDSKEMPENLPQLEPNMLDDILGDGSVLARVSPDDIIYSSELEAEWIKDSQNFNVQVPRIRDKSFSKNLPRPCSFFMEGTCRRSDCKFSHDLSKITCRFWEEGGCFKGVTCPFLHGYPLGCEDSDHEADEPCQMNLQHDDDFPDLRKYKNKETSPEPTDEKIKSKKINHKMKKRPKKSSCQAQSVKNK